MSNPSKNGSGTIDPQLCWSVLERVAATPSLKRAARLREFLLYVGTKFLREGRTDIHEQEIGEFVFGRPHDYETSQDNIVRVSATELRKRVDAYFAAEGIAEPIVFEIPRGSYLPLFHVRRSVEVLPRTVDPVAAIPETAPANQRPLLLWIISALAVLLAIACILLWHQNQNLLERIQVLERSTSQTTPQGTSLSDVIEISNGG